MVILGSDRGFICRFYGIKCRVYGNCAWFLRLLCGFSVLGRVTLCLKCRVYGKNHYPIGVCLILLYADYQRLRFLTVKFMVKRTSIKAIFVLTVNSMVLFSVKFSLKVDSMVRRGFNCRVYGKTKTILVKFSI